MLQLSRIHVRQAGAIGGSKTKTRPHCRSRAMKFFLMSEFEAADREPPAMRGRKPIPTHLHILRGTWRADRHGPKPAPPVEEDTSTPPPREPAEPLERQAATRQRRRQAIAEPSPFRRSADQNPS